MKTCPACGTQYEDHVPQCFVDGTSLEDVESEAAPAAAAAGSEASSESSGSSGGAGLGIVALLGGGVALLLFVGVIGAVAFMATGGGESDPEVKTASVPVPTPTPPPPSPDPEPTPEVHKIGLTSSPDGAEVYEGAAKLCTTPCTIEHPEHAPLPRHLVLKAPKHKDTPYSVDSYDKPHHIELIRIRRPTPRPATPRPSPTPKPKPNVVAPAIEMER